MAVLSDGSELPYALFLGVPVHRVPQVVVDSGLSAHPHDWVPVNKQTLETKFPGVYGSTIGEADLGVEPTIELLNPRRRSPCRL